LKADGRTSSLHAPSFLSPVVGYHGLARRYLIPLRFLMRPLLNGGTLGGRRELGRHDNRDSAGGRRWVRGMALPPSGSAIACTDRPCCAA